MGFLTNRNINCLNLHMGLLGLLEQAFGLFAPIYLYSRGFSLPEIFMLLALFNTARMPLRLLSFPIVRMVGLKRALMIGTAGFALSFPLLSLVHGYDIWLASYVIIFGLFNALHWHCFHTFYSLAGEHEHRGKHLAVAQGLGLGITAVAPVLSALFIVKTSFDQFFLLPLPLLALMLYVLSHCKDIPAARTSWPEGKKLIFNLGAKIHLAEASAVFPLNIGWLFAVYLYVGKIVSLGSIVTFGIVVQILYQLWLGRMIDRGHGHFVAHAAGVLRAIEVVMMAMLPLSFTRILALQALSAAANVHHGLAQPTVMYNAAKQSSDPFWYWLFAETTFDLGTIIGAGSVALLLWWGTSLQLTILMALPGVLIVWWLTYRYFGDMNEKNART